MNRWFTGLFLTVVLVIFFGHWLTVQAQDDSGSSGDQPPGWRFGVIESNESPEQADSLGVGWTRIIFHWADIQPLGPGSWEPAVDDETIERERAAGRLIVGMLIGIPDWARDERRLPEGLRLEFDNPDNTWAEYVRQVVDQYERRIDHWLIWNEPDIPDTEIAHSWDGTVSDFAQLQRVAYLAAKEANPEAVIHLSAFTYWTDYYAGTRQYMDRLLDELMADPEAADNGFYFDVASAHLYFQPDQIYDLLQLFTKAMRRRGLDQPIWLVETNAPSIDDPDWPVPNWTLSVTLREQAAFIPQALASAFAAGAERAAVYKLADTGDDREANPEPFGLLRLDGSRRPAFDTYRIAIKQLNGAFHVQRERWNEVGQIRFDQPDQTTTVLFSRLPQPQQAEVAATADFAQLVDMFGTSEVITATNGLFSVDLPGARCSQSIGDYCMIGGYTYYLVQEADVQPPTPKPSPTPSPTPTGSPTPTPRPTLAPTPSPEPSLTPPLTLIVTPSPIATSITNYQPPATSHRPPAASGQSPTADPFPIPALVIGGLFLMVLALGLGWYYYKQRKGEP